MEDTTMLDQYRIPMYPEREADSLLTEQTTEPERQGPRFAWAHAIQEEIQAMRDTADESVLIRDRISRLFRSVTQKIITPAPGYSLERALVDRESEIGGSLFPPENSMVSRRFWYFDGDWYFEEREAKQSFVARYTLYGESIEKLVHGRPVAIEPQEEVALVAAIPLYKQRIESELYKPSSPQAHAA